MIKRDSLIRKMAIMVLIITMIMPNVRVFSAPYDEDGSWRVMPIRSEEEALAGAFGGEGEQCMHAVARSFENPDYIYAAQDVTGVWRSTDGGYNWQHVNGNGLYVDDMFGLQVDPRDPDIVIAMALDLWNGADPGNNMFDYQGMYRTTDGGETWTQVLHKDLNIDWGSERRVYENIAYDYSAMTDTDTHAMIWYAAIGDDWLYKSVNGGIDWEPITDLRAYTLVNAVKVDDEGQVYIHTEQQLFKLNMETYLLEPMNSLPVDDSDAQIKRDENGNVTEDRRTYLSYFEIDPDNNQVMYAAVMSRNYDTNHDERLDGIYKSTNGGVDFVRILEYPGCIVKVSPADSNVIYCVSRLSMARPMKVTHDGGQTWFDSPREYQITGDLGNAYKRGVGIESTAVMPHPTDPMEAAFYSQMAFWHTTDGAKSLVDYTNDGFTGFAWTWNSSGVAFDTRIDPSTGLPNEGRYAFFCCDVGTVITENDGYFFERIMPEQMRDWRNNGYIFGGGTYAGTFCPELPPEDNSAIDRSGIIVATLGQYQDTQIMRSTDNGATWELEHYYSRTSNDLDEVQAYRDNTVYNRFLSFNPVKTYMVVGEDKISYDYGESFEPYNFNNRPKDFFPDGTLDTREISSGSVLGFTGEESQIFYMMTDANRRLYRSNDYGSTWVYYGDSPTQMKGFDGRISFSVNKTEEDVIYTVGSNGQMLIYDGKVWYESDVLSLSGNVENNEIRSIVADPQDGNVVYCSSIMAGVPNVFMSTDGGGTWEDISEDLPKVGTMTLNVHPVTRELFAGSHIGTWIYTPSNLPAPGDTVRQLPDSVPIENRRGGYEPPKMYVPDIELDPTGTTVVNTTNLEMYWNFQNVEDVVIEDVSGNEWTAYMTGGEVITDDIIGDDKIDSGASGEGVVVEPMAYGHSVYLNEPDESIILPVTEPLLTTAMTLNISFKMSQIEIDGDYEGQQLIQKGNYCNPFSIGVDGWGRPYASIRTTNGTRRLESSRKINFDQWSTVSLVIDGSQAKLYVRGEETASISDLEGLIADGTRSIYLGSKDSSLIDCYIDEVSLFSEALSQQDIIELSYYGPIVPNLEEEIPPVEEPVELPEGIIYNETFEEGLVMVANEDWVEIDDTEFEWTDSLSVVTEFEVNELINNQVLVQKGKYCYPFSLSLFKTGEVEARIRTQEGTHYVQTVKDTINLEGINTLAMTYSTGTLNLYINGVLVASESGIEGSLVYKEKPLFLLSSEDNIVQTDNTITMYGVSIYNQCLSAEDIAGL